MEKIINFYTNLFNIYPIYVNVEFLLTIILFGVSLLFVGISFLVGNLLIKNPDVTYEKVSSYECGFEAFSDAREPFDIKFYLIAILFIIFDVEVLFFFPYIFSMKEVFLLGLYNLILFFIILMIGFLYEWKKGCMDW